MSVEWQNNTAERDDYEKKIVGTILLDFELFDDVDTYEKSGKDFQKLKECAYKRIIDDFIHYLLIQAHA